MKLKNYQKEVLSDLERFVTHVNDCSSIAQAYSDYWAEKGIIIDRLGKNQYLQPYTDTIKGVPNVTIKVPTAGGKTFIACNALKYLFAGFPSGRPKVVAWFVPSDSILKQTLRNLRSGDHPYRQCINSLFGNRVHVVDKEDALRGYGISPIEIREQLTIFVLSVQSFATSAADKRRVYRENENLAEYSKFYNSLTKIVEGADGSSLIQILSFLNPTVIVDESHNFKADLRKDALTAINPRFIFNLTATPRENSNIISFVDAIKLKMANMVKLPVIVYNHSSTDEVIRASLKLQKSLEERAIKAKSDGGEYIRPIVLFQAQAKTEEDSVTFLKIKKSLIDGGIPEDQVKIKTAVLDELKNVDLMREDCPVRFIITVNALKEGWDCPFAYILASVANRSSSVDVEQILGRVLRLPYASHKSDPLLNLSYVFTSSADFRETINNVVASLNNAGFSRKDCRVKEDPEKMLESESSAIFENLLFSENSASENENGSENANDVPTVAPEVVKEALDSASNDTATQEIERVAIEQSADYDKQLTASEDNPSGVSTEIAHIMPENSFRDYFAEDAISVKIPRFMVKMNVENLFEGKVQLIPLDKAMLTRDFDITKQNTEIIFKRTTTDAVSVDLALINREEYGLQRSSLDSSFKNALKEEFKSMPTENKVNNIARTITRLMHYEELPDRQVEEYIKSALKGLDSEIIDDILTFDVEYARIVKEKIEKLLLQHRKNVFSKWLDSGYISCLPDYSFPLTNSVKKAVLGIPKSLYQDEGDMNGFEERVITAIAELENVLYWHRNPDRGVGFGINGFINHYPDFIVRFKSGKIAMIETKGDDRDNSDSKNKVELGEYWKNKAGSDYRYYMVFDTVKMDGAYTLNELLDRIAVL